MPYQAGGDRRSRRRSRCPRQLLGAFDRVVTVPEPSRTPRSPAADLVAPSVLVRDDDREGVRRQVPPKLARLDVPHAAMGVFGAAGSTGELSPDHGDAHDATEAKCAATRPSAATCAPTFVVIREVTNVWSSTFAQPTKKGPSARTVSTTVAFLSLTGDRRASPSSARTRPGSAPTTRTARRGLRPRSTR